MEEKALNVMFNKNGKGYTTTRIAIPSKWIRALDVSEEDREVICTIDHENEIITIKKANRG